MIWTSAIGFIQYTLGFILLQNVFKVYIPQSFVFLTESHPKLRKVLLNNSNVSSNSNSQIQTVVLPSLSSFLQLRQNLLNFIRQEQSDL